MKQEQRITIGAVVGCRQLVRRPVDYHLREAQRVLAKRPIVDDDLREISQLDCEGYREIQVQCLDIDGLLESASEVTLARGAVIGPDNPREELARLVGRALERQPEMTSRAPDF